MKKNSFFLIIIFMLSISSGCAPAASQPLTASPAIPASATTPAPAEEGATRAAVTNIPPSPTPIPRVTLPVRGLYVQFEARGHPSFYWSGDAINRLNDYDEIVGHTVAEEMALQLDKMKEMGVNAITFELRAADPVYIPGPYVPPACNIGPALGLQYPQPTSQEIENLKSFLDLLERKEMKLFLRLVNTHMEEQPPTKNTLWLGSILNAVKDKPALDLILFEGYPFMLDMDGDGIKDTCGVPAEPELWMGPTSIGARYVKWAIEYGHSFGIPYRKLSAEAIVGNNYSFTQGPAGASATDGHQWDPVFVLKGIFDDLNVPNEQRTYAISFHEHRKCTTMYDLPCDDLNPHAWAVETVTHLFDTIGRQTGARVVAVEMGLNPPVEKTWTTEMAVESLIWIMQNYGIEGGGLWRWTSFYNSEDLDATLQTPIKQRGVEFTYNPVKEILEQLYTQGQTDDFNPTPDSISPAFDSVSAGPGIVKNGDEVEITANLNETHLFVWVEMAQVDSGQPDPIVLIDQGDGTYKRRVKLSLWNEMENGVKSLPVSAMDFWSNSSATTVKLELKNPPAVLDPNPPNDAFEGSQLDASKWKAELAGGASVTQNGDLVVSTGDTEATSTASISSVKIFPGDFDVQVDFDISEGWNSPGAGHLDGAFLHANIGS